MPILLILRMCSEAWSQSLFFNIVADFRSATLNFAKFLRTSFLITASEGNQPQSNTELSKIEWMSLPQNVLNKKGKKIYCNDKSSRPEVLCKKGVLINFAKFTGKHLC